jgi:WXG100 family type VII secretion target
MSTTTRINYDELTLISKKFHNEGEDAAQIHSTTHQKISALRSEWVGEAADKFFEEMEGELLPGVKRLSLALVAAQDAVNNIMKTIYEADGETASYFKDGLGAGEDFGASKFGDALGDLPGQGENTTGGTGGLPGDSGSSQTPGSTDPTSTNPDGTGAPTGAYDTKALEPFKTEQSETTTETTPPEPAAASTGAGGGGGGGSSSQGLQGDLKNLGAGLGGVPANNAFVGGASGGAESLPDHSFGSAGASNAGSSTPQSPAGGASNAGQTASSDGGGAAAAGAAGVAGSAAIGAAAKILKEKQDKE